MEVFCDQQLIVLDDYVRLTAYGVDCTWKAKVPDKGHADELAFFAEEIRRGHRFPIPWEELQETWLISRQVADQLTA